MPKLAKAVYDPNDQKSWMETAKLGDDERVAREKVIDEAWAYFYGNHRLPLKTPPTGPNYNVILNFCGQALDALVAFLGTPDLQVEGGVAREPNADGLLTTLKTPQQVALEALWEANELELLIVDLLLSGMVSGHTFLKLIPQIDIDGAIIGVRIELLDPRHVTVYWSSHRQVLFYRLKWQVDADETRTQDIVPAWLLTPSATDDPAPDADAPTTAPTGWRILEWSQKSSREKVLVGDDVWAYPFPPVTDWKNAPKPFDYYGRSDLAPATLRKNDAANLVASDTQKIIFHHAGPTTIVTGGRLPDDWESAPDRAIDDLPADAKVYNLEMAGDLSSSMNFLNVLRGAFFEGVKVVDRASIKDKLGDLTNFAVRMLYGSQQDSAAQKHTLYGRGLALASERALIVSGVSGEASPDVKVLCKWADLLPQDRAEIVRAVAIEDDMGFVSEQTMTEELGHDPVIEAEQRAEEGERAQTSVAEALVRIGGRGGLNGGRRG